MTFKTEKALQYASKGAQGVRAPLFLGKYKLKMKEPCEPDEFQWDNAHITVQHPVVKKIAPGASRKCYAIFGSYARQPIAGSLLEER